MKAWILTGALLLAAGGAGALASGGYHQGGSGTDLQPLEEACLCYGYGTGYGLWAEGQGSFHVHHDYWEQVSHGTPPTTGPEVGWDVNTGRWLDAWGSVPEGRVEARSNGGGWVNTPGPSEGGLANQGFGLGDVRLTAHKDQGARAEVHNGVHGSAVHQDAHMCLDASHGNLPGGVGVNLNHHLQGYPAGAFAGNCWFQPG